MPQNEKKRIPKKCYEFTVYMIGWGKTPEDAWEQAVNNVFEDPDDFGSTENLPDYVERDEDPIYDEDEDEDEE